MAKFWNTDDGLDDMMENISDGFFVLDDDFTVRYFNKTAEKLLGRNREDVIGRKLFDSFPEARGSIFETNYSRAINEKIPLTFETYFGVSPYADWYEVRVNPRKTGGITVFFQVITARKKAGEMLEESENKFKSIAENAVDFIFIKDIARRYTFVNRSMQELLGLSQEEILGKTPDEIFGPELGRIVLEVDDRSFSGEIVDETRSFVIKDREFIFHTIQKALEKEDGKIISIMGIVRDITERKKAEEEQRETLQRLAFALQGGNLGMWDWNPQDGEVVYNDLWAQMLEYRIDEVEPTVEFFKQHVHPEDQAAVLDRLTGHIEGRLPVYESEHRMRTKSGRWMWVRDRGKITARDKEGHPVRVTGVITDITERKKAEEEYRKSQEQLKLKLDSILTPETDMDEEELANIIDKNELQPIMDYFFKVSGMANAIIDLKGNILVGAGWQDICTQFHRTNPEAEKNCIESDTFFTRNIKKGKTLCYKCKNHMWDVATPLFIGDKHVGNVFLGQFFYYDDNIDTDLFIDQAKKYGFDKEAYLAALERVPRLSREQVNNVISFLEKFTRFISKLSKSNITLAREIIERKKAEEELKIAKEKAEKINEAKSEFLMNVSHDIRTPMNVINGFNELLMKTPLSDEQKKFCTTIKRKGQDLISLIEDIIDISALENGKVRMHYSPVSLIDLIEDIRETTLVRIGDKDISFSSSIDESVFAKLMGDSMRMKQILENLCGNAVKYTDKGKISLKISAIDKNIMEKTQTIRFVVEDTGTGIPKDKISHIFEPYFRFYELGKHNEKDGVGMGLHIVKTLVKEMGGKINVESEPGKGSKFTVDFKMKEPEVNAEEKKDEKPEETLEASDLAGINILIAEDNEDSRELMSMALADDKCNIQFACDGEEVLKSMKKKKYDLVLMDLRMPKLDGFKTTMAIRKDIDKNIPILALTAHVADWVEGECKDAGMNGYISKPIDINKLKTAILKFGVRPRN
ncbi:MAG: PocR ligand-binding domain-containing protein [Candidatus Omnitrophica bacterium]|nr:PocR ligand-binding domain-containing protein [Candidatus Omnitrophota bacterium]